MRYRILLPVVLLALATTSFAGVVVVNAASFRPGEPVAAGSIASAYRSEGAPTKFPGVVSTRFDGAPWPTQLAGVRVLVNDIACPLYFVSDDHMSFQVPGALEPGKYPIKVITATEEQDGMVTVMSAAPGIFADYSIDPPLGAVLNQDSSINGENNPEQRGRALQVYATGPGKVDRPVADGEVAPSAEPYARTISTPRVYIAGVEVPTADVIFSGLAPGLIGLWQVNFIIPDLPFITGRVPLSVYIDGVDSNEVSIFVAP